MIDGEQLINDLLRDFEEHGVSVLDRLAKENPLAYLQVAPALVCDIHEYVEVDGDEENEA